MNRTASEYLPGTREAQVYAIRNISCYDHERRPPNAIQTPANPQPPPVLPAQHGPDRLLVTGILPPPGAGPVTTGRVLEEPVDDDQRDHLQPPRRDGNGHRSPRRGSGDGIAPRGVAGT